MSITIYAIPDQQFSGKPHSTGMKPHECNFGCGKAFSDPARKHKHMVEVHNYIPKGPRKRSKAAIEAQNSRFETMAPWVAKSDLGGGQ